MVYFFCTSTKWVYRFMSSRPRSCGGEEDGAESWQERTHPPPNPSFSLEDFTYFSSTQDAFKVESKWRGGMTTLATATWFETPCFYPLPHPVPCSGCSALPLARPSNSQPPDSPRCDPELLAPQMPPTQHRRSVTRSHRRGITSGAWLGPSGLLHDCIRHRCPSASRRQLLCPPAQ